MARRLCAPREVVVERLFKKEDQGIDVILFSSIGGWRARLLFPGTCVSVQQHWWVAGQAVVSRYMCICSAALVVSRLHDLPWQCPHASLDHSPASWRTARPCRPAGTPQRRVHAGSPAWADGCGTLGAEAPADGACGSCGGCLAGAVLRVALEAAGAGDRAWWIHHQPPVSARSRCPAVWGAQLQWVNPSVPWRPHTAGGSSRCVLLEQVVGAGALPAGGRAGGPDVRCCLPCREDIHLGGPPECLVTCILKVQFAPCTGL
jgi:hypothetical protein